MPKPNKKRQHKDVQSRTIFLIKDPLTKDFIVDYTLSHRVRKTYAEHYIGNQWRTESVVRKLKSAGLKPCCFELETLSCTEVEAYRHIVVWTKIFIEKGLSNLDKGTVVYYANELLPVNISLYEERKNESFDSLLACSNCLFPDYGRKMCPLMKE